MQDDLTCSFFAVLMAFTGCLHSTTAVGNEHISMLSYLLFVVGQILTVQQNLILGHIFGFCLFREVALRQ